MTVEMVLEKVKELCEAHGASEVILYGSRAKGTAVDLLDLDTCGNELLLEDIRKYGRKI